MSCRPYVVRWDLVRGRVWWQHRHGRQPTRFGWFTHASPPSASST